MKLQFFTKTVFILSVSQCTPNTLELLSVEQFSLFPATNPTSATMKKH